MTAREEIGPGGSKGAALARRLAVVTAMILAPCAAGAGEARPAAAPLELPRQDFPEPVLGSLRTALEAYEEVRGELAADRLEGVPAGAGRLAGALRRALEDRAGLGGGVPAVIEEAAHLAESMAAAEDLAAARAAFGEVSRRVLRLASSDPRLAAGRYVFACPMAEPFGKWIQPTAALGNPYLGRAMPTCGSPADWSQPAPASAEPARSSGEDSGAEPEFRPGIPGLEMADVRDHRHLWREIEELQIWERGDRISVAEYRSKVIEKTAHFLGLAGSAADEFAAAASAAVTTIRESFVQARGTGVSGDVGERFSADLGAAATRVTAFLRDEPRHRLFAPDCKKWLLRLAFGPSEAKEAREAARAREGSGGDEPGAPSEPG